MVPTLHSSSPPRKGCQALKSVILRRPQSSRLEERTMPIPPYRRFPDSLESGGLGSQRRRWPPLFRPGAGSWVPAFAGMTEGGEVPSANSHHSEVNERLSPPSEKPGARCSCCYLHRNISYASVLRRRFPWFSNSMRLRKQQRTWLFVAVPGCFREARLGSGSQMHAAGDYQFDSEMASHNSYLSNYGEGRSALGGFFATRLVWTPGGPSPHRRQRRCCAATRHSAMSGVHRHGSTYKQAGKSSLPGALRCGAYPKRGAFVF